MPDEPLTPEALAAIRERAEEATPGPWTAEPRSVFPSEEDCFLGWEIEGPPDADRGQFARGADARFIAHARTDVPALLAEVERLWGEAKRLAERGASDA